MFRGFLAFLTAAACFWAVSGTEKAFAFSEETVPRPMLTKNAKQASVKEVRWEDEVAGKVSSMTNNFVAADGSGVIDIYTAADPEDFNEISPSSGGPLPFQYGKLAGFGVQVGQMHFGVGYSAGVNDPSTFDNGEGAVIAVGFTQNDWNYSANYIHGAEDKIGYDRGDANKLGLSARHQTSKNSAFTVSLQASDFTNSADDDVRLTFGFTKKLEVSR